MSLLLAARAAFGAHGYDGTSVEEILDLAGVTAPTLYHHFANKDGLYCEAASHAFGEIFERIVRHADGKQTGAERIQAVFFAGLESVRDVPDIVSFVHHVPVDLSKRRELDAARAGYSPIAAWLVAAVKDGQLDGSLTLKCSESDLTTIVFTIISGLSAQVLSGIAEFEARSRQLIRAFEPDGVFGAAGEQRSEMNRSTVRPLSRREIDGTPLAAKTKQRLSRDKSFRTFDTAELCAAFSCRNLKQLRARLLSLGIMFWYQDMTKQIVVYSCDLPDELRIKVEEFSALNA